MKTEESKSLGFCFFDPKEKNIAIFLSVASKKN